MFLAGALATAPLAVAAVDCGECHDVEADPILDGPHGFLDCTDCHSGYDEELHPEELSAPACSDCHDDVVAALGESVHSAVDGVASADGCAACHGAAHGGRHESPTVSKRLLAEACGSCHSDPEQAERFQFHLVKPLEAYLEGVHAQALADGGPSCGDCHGSHGILPAVDSGSSVNRMRVPDTCGSCHQEIASAYESSVHGQAVQHGVLDSPVCTDCHGEHRIASPASEGSPVFASNIPKMTCGRCHSDVRLAEKYGLDLEKVPAYEDSYHGLAGRAGTVSVAHCGSCHGIHDILSSTDPASHVHKDNLAGTCGSCHPGAGTVFAIGEVHVLATDAEHAAVFWIRRLYLGLIFLVIGGMVLHNGLDLVHKARRPDLIPHRVPHSKPIRMSVGFRLAHLLLLSSFFVLVFTGFALKYPEAWWASPLLLWEDSFGLRGWLHRVAAVVLMAAAGVHVVHLALSRLARRDIAAFMPARSDWHELKAKILFLIGLRKDPPPAVPVGYSEKAEYLAVIWGTLIMAITGFMLWFDDAMLRWLPKWLLDVATAVHFYEAILASLAILVWHFYFVMLDPVVYPMDTAWITGRSAPRRFAERLQGLRSGSRGERADSD